MPFQPVPSLLSTMNRANADEVRQTMGIAQVLGQVQDAKLRQHQAALQQQRAMREEEAFGQERALREFLASKAQTGQVPTMGEVLPYNPELGVRLGSMEQTERMRGDDRASREDLARMNDETRKQMLMDRYAEMRRLQDERFAQQEFMARLAAGMRQGPQPQAPIAVEGPDGQPLLVPPAQAYGKRPWKEARGADAPATLKPLPPTMAKAYIENNSALAKVDRAKKAIEQTPNATGVRGMVPDIALQRFDPNGVDARAAIADIGSLVIHDRSGAAVTAAEFPRLRPFIPNVTDTPSVVKKKLKNFEREYQTIQGEIEEYATSQGYKSPRGAAPAPAPAGVMDDAALLKKYGL